MGRKKRRKIENENKSLFTIDVQMDGKGEERKWRENNVLLFS